MGPAEYWFGQTRLDSALVWHVAANTPPGSAVGADLIQHAKQAIGLGLAAQRYGAQWYGEGGHPTTVLYSDQKLEAETAATIKERFLDATRARREPAVLGAGLKVERIQDSASDSDLVNAWAAVRTDVAGYFRLPPEWLGGSVGGTSITYANVEQRQQHLSTVTLLPWVVILEEAFADLVRPGIVTKLNLDALVRADLATRTNAEIALTNAGLLLPNEARALEDRPPLPGGDEPRVGGTADPVPPSAVVPPAPPEEGT
jgi:HK97 family phage portal protein